MKSGMFTREYYGANVPTMTNRTPSLINSFPILSSHGPGHIVLQFSDACKAICPQCAMRMTERFERTKMDCDSAKRIIDIAAQRGVKALSVTGGESLRYLDEILELLKYAKAAGINVTSTGTNGHLFAYPYRPDYLNRITEAAERLAESGIYAFWINIDSADPVVHQRMSGLPDVMDGIEIALPIFHDHGIYPSANLWINKNIGGLSQASSSNPFRFFAFYRKAFQKFFNLAIDLGFTIASVCHPMHRGENNRNGPDACGATTVTDMARYTSAEKELVIKALFYTIPEFRHRIRILSPRSSLLSLMRHYAGGDNTGHHFTGAADHLFVDGRDANFYSSGYQGDEHDRTLWHPGPAQIDQWPLCRKNYRECLRDPSEMIRFMISLFTSPHLIYGEMLQDDEFNKLWMEDFRYFRDCDFFDCSKAPDFRKLDFIYQQEGPSA